MPDNSASARRPIRHGVHFPSRLLWRTLGIAAVLTAGRAWAGPPAVSSLLADWPETASYSGSVVEDGTSIPTVENDAVAAVLWPALRVVVEDEETKGPAGPKRRMLEALGPDSFVGLLKVLAPLRDARSQPIAATLYQMRYVVQPMFKDHMATPYNRDFLLLLPASLDPGEIDHGQLLASSAELGTYGHPLVLAVLPDTEEGQPVQTTEGTAGRTIRVAIENHRLLLVLP